MLGTQKTGKAFWPSPFSKREFETRWKKLETEPDTELHLPGVIALAVHNTEGGRRGWIDALGKERGVRICEHRVVEYVGDDVLELQADALYDMNVFHHSHVHVPVRQATEHANAASPGVETQNWGTKGVQYAIGIRIDVELPSITILVERG